MEITNRFNLPQALVDAVKNDPYNKGSADFSITELLTPPRQRALKIKYKDQLTEDVSDRLWSLYGQIAHLILERANRRDFVEKRFFMDINGKVISGQIDTLCLDDGILSDYKLTAAYGFMGGRPPKDEWVAQLNMQRYLLWHNDYMNIRGLRIIGLLRDYQASKAKDDEKYPQHMVAYHDIPMWSMDVTKKVIIKRINLHLEAEKELPLCKVAETWRARRCAGYCSVAKFCDQYQSALSTGLLKNGEE